MAWFITTVDPCLSVQCADGHTLRFRDAEYRTEIPGELEALRADPRVREVLAEVKAGPILRRWVVNLATGKVHDVVRRRFHCYLSDELIAASRLDDGDLPNWKLYHRLDDLKRWNTKTAPCKYCKGGADV